MVKMIKKLITTALILSLCISSIGTFAFATETSEEPAATVNVSLVKYSGSASVDENDEYEGTTVSIDGVTRPVLVNAEFQLIVLKDGEYVLVEDGLVTDENGYLTVKDLPADGEYYFQETAPAEGYLLEEAYVKAIPWSDEEVITYAVSTKRELPSDEYIDEEFEEPAEEPEEVPAVDEEDAEQDLPESGENDADEETAADVDNPKTGDNSTLLIMAVIFAIAVCLVYLLRKRA